MKLTSALLSANYGLSNTNVRIYELFTNRRNKSIAQGLEVITPYSAHIAVKAVCLNEINEDGSTIDVSVKDEQVAHLDVSGVLFIGNINPLYPTELTFDRSFRFEKLVSDIDSHLNEDQHIRLSSQELTEFHVKKFAVALQSHLIRQFMMMDDYVYKSHQQAIVSCKTITSWIGDTTQGKDLLQAHEVSGAQDIIYATYEMAHFVYQELLSQLVGMLSVEYAPRQKQTLLKIA